MTEPVVTSSPFTIWLRRVRVMTAKELLQLFRNIPVMLFLVYAFTMDIYLAGSGVSLELTNGRFLVHDADHSAASRELIYRLGFPSFRFEGELQDSQEGAQRLDRGQAMMALDIPPQFEESLAKGEQTSVQLQIDTTNAPLGLQAASYSARIVGQYELEASLARLGISADKQDAVPSLIDQNRVWYNPNQNETWFMSVAELLSGIWTPPEAMPEMLRYLMAISPLYYFIDISYGIFLKGSGLDILWESIVGMAVIGSINFSLGMWRFRKQFQ